MSVSAKSHTPARADAQLIADLEAANLHPVWDRFKTLTPPRPMPAERPFLWRWRDIEPFVERAAREVDVADVERRALILAHPDFPGRTATTPTMIAAFTVLEPGDKARPHRHTASALRFATQAEGALTIVNGRRCDMNAGDFILTPPMSWHGHFNASDKRSVWFDIANMPLMKALDANFFEGGDNGDDAFWTVDEGHERIWRDSGFAPDGVDPAEKAKFHYAGATAARHLDLAPAATDGSRTLRYRNPVDGGPVMPTIDALRLRLSPDRPTRPRRMTWNAICLAFRGSGRTTIGDTVIEWTQNDVFTIPHWMAFSHQAGEHGADLFIVTDRPVYESLGLGREELL